ncbi:hypothetical protein MY11210_004857 [Beauveria gryllotalpidicola]
MAAPTTQAPPTEFALALFNGFQALDAFGPLDTLNLLSRIDKDNNRKISLSVLAATKDAVSTAAPDAHQTIEQWVLPTHTFDDAPDNIEVLIIPGGQGTRTAETIQPTVDFVRARFPKLRFVLTICTGTVILARAGLLNGLRATTNKCAFDWVVEASKEGSPDVEWVRRARWVDSGKIWTASGVTAGMDAMFAFVAQEYGEEVAHSIAVTQEYSRQTDSTNDPFAKVDYVE